MKDVFDLGSVEVADIAKLAIKHPTTSKPTTWVLDIAGPGHPVSEAIQNEAARERLQLQRDQEMARVNGRKWKGGDVDPEAENQKVFGRIAKRILSWSDVSLNGQAYPYSPANALALMREPRFAWVANQILEFLGEDAAFIRASATN